MKFGIFKSKLNAQTFNTYCSVCKKIAAEITLTETSTECKLAFKGIVAGNGAGDSISQSSADAIKNAFTAPYIAEKIKAAAFYDDAGFCIACEKFYCVKHWQISATGGGTCPAGHFKSLDPHWSPE